ARDVLRSLIDNVKAREQVAICIRFVPTCDFVPKEMFLGFFRADNTWSETLFHIVSASLASFGLSFEDLRGQAYDGAKNMSGEISGLKTLITQRNETALYVHCMGHRANSTVQDAFETNEIQAALAVLQCVSRFVRSSPKR